MTGDKAFQRLIKSIGRDVVHIKVGKDLQDFGVHRGLICHYSPYFKAAFTSGFAETNSGVMKLPDVKVEVFELFFHWLYTQQINKPCSDLSPSNSGEDSSAARSKPDMRSRIRAILELYIFADMVQVSTIKNNCIKVYSEMSVLEKECLVELPNQRYIWEHTTENDLIRKFMVDLTIWDVPGPSFVEFSGQFAGILAVELNFAMRKIIDDARAEAEEQSKRPRKAKGLASLVSPLEDLTKYYQKVKDEEGKMIDWLEHYQG